MRKFRKLFWSAIILLALAIVAIFYCNKVIVKNAEGKLYADIQTIPYNKVGLLLGTSKYISKNYPNPYYSYRIDAALQLFRAHKIRYIVVSGDNSTANYNEPKQMQSDLMKAGIDSANIYLDYAGFRTFDSIIRLKEIFGQDSATIISQPFHNERAIYIATRENIHAIGYNATDVSSSFGLRIQIREKFARVKVFLDYLRGIQPKFLGKKIIIPA